MNRTRRSLRYISVLALVAVLSSYSGFLAAENTPDTLTTGKVHRISFPTLDLNAPTPCLAEMTAYAAAVADLEEAQGLADEAWDALAECLDAEEDPPEEGDLNNYFSEDTVSILELR